MLIRYLRLRSVTAILAFTHPMTLDLICQAQESRATVIGQVRDSSAAVIPNATVRITNIATGVTTAIPTNEQGNYAAPYLLPGAYSVVCDANGFKQSRRDAVELRVNDRVEINFALQVGDASETIVVTGESTLLETATASAGQVIDGRRISELPMPHGIPFNLMALSPGLACVNCIQVNDSPYDSFSQSYAVAGTRAQLSEILVDGVPTSSSNNGPNALITSWVPPADVVAEMKVQTATYDAGVGFSSAGAVNVTLKSGTNRLHGTLFYANIATALIGNTYFANSLGIPRGDITYHRWGSTAGGPVLIPKLYNGRNRTFFFYGYEGLKQNRIRGTTLTIPTAKERQGDFSDLLALGSRYQIYDPATRRSIAGGRFQQDPFPGNIIPTGRISPIAQNILKYYPLPVLQGTADGTNNLPLPNATEEASYFTVTGRIDHNFSSRNRIFVRGNGMERNSVAVDWFHNLATARPFEFQSRGGIVDDVFTVSPTFIVNFHYGYDRFVRIFDSLPEAHGFDLTALGFPAYYNNAIPVSVRRFPYITIGGYAPTWNGSLNRPNDNHDLTLTFNKVARTHAVKFGGSYRIYRQNQYQPDNESTGNFNFGTTYTQGPLDNSPASPLGQGLASMLLGLPSSGYVDRRSSYAEQSTNWGLYVHDDWKVSKRLSINAGVRYETESPITERYNRSALSFDQAAALPIAAQVQAAYAKNPTDGLPIDQFRVQGGLTFAGINNNSRDLWNRYAKSIMPRLGLAYSLNSKTVLRTGYGIYYGFLGTRRTNVIQTVGFTQRTTLVPSLDGGLTFAATLANPYPNGIQEPLGAAAGPSTGIGQIISFFNQHPLPSYMQRWSFGIQRELPLKIVIDLSYVGNRGTHLEVAQDLNALPLKYLSSLPVRDTANINYLTASVPNPFYPQFPNTALAGTVVSRSSLLVPYPQFSSVASTNFQGYSWYHSLDAKTEKRFSRGMTITVAYTYSKFMEATSRLNPADPMPTRVISDQDFTHRLSASAIFELPFGAGHRILGGARGLLNGVVNGWQAEGIFVGQVGAPISWGNILFNGDIHDIALPVGERNVAHWINVNAGFVRNSALQLSQNIRTFPTRLSGVRGPGINNYDLSAIKKFKIRETTVLQFRAEAINALNHPLFANPNVDPTSSAFGVITTQNNNSRRLQLGLKMVF